MTFTLDTNIMSYLLKGDKNILANLQNIIKESGKMIINPITYYEIYRGLLYKKADSQLAKFKEYCGRFENCEFNQKIFIKAAEIYNTLRNTGKIIEDADIFIAAICIEYGYTLIRNNEKHFGRISDLKTVNWI